MTNESNRNNYGEILLTDVPTKLRKARNVATNVPYELHDFCDYLANVANDQIVPAGMVILLTCVLDDLKKERCGFANKVPFPDELKEENFRLSFI